VSLRDGDDLAWYARKAARLWGRSGAPGEEPAALDAARLRTRLAALRAAGVKGDPSSMTFYTKRVPPGCRGCLAGRGTNALMTGLCTRDCFFCFNRKPRVDEFVVHGIPVETAEQGAEIVSRYDLRSVGISGGEPLLRPERVLVFLRAVRALPGPRRRIDLYTNGDRATDALLGRLKRAGLDSVRVDLAARDYDTTPVETARRWFDEVTVEIPVIPGHEAALRRMVDRLDALAVPFLNLHELFACDENRERVLSGGRAEGPGVYRHLLWKPVAESGLAALDLLLYAVRCRVLSAYLCSCGTQELISRRGLARRAAGAPAA
jgi:uncharacterized protein